MTGVQAAGVFRKTGVSCAEGERNSNQNQNDFLKCGPPTHISESTFVPNRCTTLRLSVSGFGEIHHRCETVCCNASRFYVHFYRHLFSGRGGFPYSLLRQRTETSVTAKVSSTRWTQNPRRTRSILRNSDSDRGSRFSNRLGMRSKSN